jgi:type I restriction enzyme R subunit
MNDVPMAGHRDGAGEYQRGIEDYLPNTQYDRDVHHNAVLQDIADNWEVLSQSGKFHAILATSSITEAITYYRLMKTQCPTLKISALFDPHISDDDTGGTDPAFKAAGLEEIIKDYNANYGQKFDMGTHGNFKKDLAARLAHKAPYLRVEAEPEKRLDLLIVVNQMLTGFDSKWVNTLYCDKLLEYENIIQAFSRTNRLFGPDKPFGTIRYYRKPHTMKRNVDAAVKLYSGDKPIGLFADQLPRNLERLNDCFTEITAIFSAAGITDFAKLPNDLAARAAFAKQFNRFSGILEASKIQGFAWDKSVCAFDTNPKQTVAVAITQQQYVTLLQRYKELGTGVGVSEESIPFDIDSHITEIDTGKIDADYMNSRFAKYIKVLQSGDGLAKEQTLAEIGRASCRERV